jgi:hypothetical protein
MPYSPRIFSGFITHKQGVESGPIARGLTVQYLRAPAGRVLQLGQSELTSRRMRKARRVQGGRQAREPEGFIFRKQSEALGRGDMPAHLLGQHPPVDLSPFNSVAENEVAHRHLVAAKDGVHQVGAQEEACELVGVFSQRGERGCLVAHGLPHRPGRVEVRRPQVLTQHPRPEVLEGDSLKDIVLCWWRGEREHRLRQNLAVPRYERPKVPPEMVPHGRRETW